MVERLVKIWFPDQVSGPPVGCGFAVRRVAIFLFTIEGQNGNPLLREWKASVGIERLAHVERRGR